MTVDAPLVPLAPHWLSAEAGAFRAGLDTIVRVRLRNDGSATWRSRDVDGLQLAFHWLDPRGNPIVWDGTRTPFPHPIPPGTEIELVVSLRAPRPPGRYVLRFDLVEEHHFWLQEVGCDVLDVEAEVLPRIAERRLAVVVHGGRSAATDAALAAQEESLVTDAPVATAHLIAGAEPPPDWSRRLLDAHEEGWAAVGPALVVSGRGPARRYAAWAPGGRNPRFGGPLLLPSLLTGIEPCEQLGLPAYEGPDALFDGRVAVTLPPRSGRRPT